MSISTSNEDQEASQSHVKQKNNTYSWQAENTTAKCSIIKRPTDAFEFLKQRTKSSKSHPTLFRLCVYHIDETLRISRPPNPLQIKQAPYVVEDMVRGMLIDSALEGLMMHNDLCNYY